MATVTLVVLSDSPDDEADDRISPFLSILEAAGREVEVVPIGDRGPRLADGAIRGLRSSSGDAVVIIDLNRPYTPEDVLAVVGPLLAGEADVAIGCPGTPKLSARLLAPIARTADPWSGLVAVRRETIGPASSRLRPVGERFALEIVQRAEGRRVDVPLPDRPGDSPRGWHLDDIRHLKRLADDRLGMISRLAQFCFVGASGMVIDLSTYALFQWSFRSTWLAERTLPILGSPLDLAAAGVLSVSLALVWNFSLNRRLTFNDARKSSLPRQFVTYVLSNALGDHAEPDLAAVVAAVDRVLRAAQARGGVRGDRGEHGGELRDGSLARLPERGASRRRARGGGPRRGRRPSGPVRPGPRRGDLRRNPDFSPDFFAGVPGCRHARFLKVSSDACRIGDAAPRRPHEVPSRPSMAVTPMSTSPPWSGEATNPGSGRGTPHRNRRTGDLQVRGLGPVPPRARLRVGPASRCRGEPHRDRSARPGPALRQPQAARPEWPRPYRTF